MLVKSLYENDSKVEMVLTFFVVVILQIRAREQKTKRIAVNMNSYPISTEICTGTWTVLSGKKFHLTVR